MRGRRTKPTGSAHLTAMAWFNMTGRSMPLSSRSPPKRSASSTMMICPMSEAAPALIACRCFQIDLHFRQARHRDLPIPWVEAIEPSLDADGCDREVTYRGVVDTFDAASAWRRARPDESRPSHLNNGLDRTRSTQVCRV